MDSFISKISPYNIFINLFPGIIFAFFIPLTTAYEIPKTNIINDIFIYYFIGLIINRIGSLVLKNLLKIPIKIKKQEYKFLHFADYTEYTSAVKEDKTISDLSITNNTYRSLTACFLILIAIRISTYIPTLLKLLINLKPYSIDIFLITLFLIFAISYRTQTKYISDKISAILNK